MRLTKRQLKRIIREEYYAGEIEYEEARQIMLDMVASGMLIDDHEDFFSVHPNYM